MSTPKPPQSGAITLVLALLSMFPPLATDMYLAAMGDLAKALDASDAGAELSLSLFFLGLGLGQLLIGPLIDAYGRKAPLLAGTALFTVASIALLLVPTIAAFNVLRVLQALGACAGMVVGRAIVSDLYHGRKAAQVLTVLVMLMTLGPILAPSLGSLLLVGFGWRSIFVALVGIGAVAFVLTQAVIPETLPRAARRPDAVSGALRHMATLVTRRDFILPTLVAGLIQAAMFAFITGSSGVFQGGFGLSAQGYGLLFGLIASALVLFGQINAWLLTRYEPRQILKCGLPLSLAAAAMLFLAAPTQTLWVLVAPLWLAIGCVGLLSANAMSIAMEASPDAVGTGSACLGAVQFGLAFTTSSLVALLGTDTARPMAAAILVTSLAASVLWALCQTRSPEAQPGE